MLKNATDTFFLENATTNLFFHYKYFVIILILEAEQIPKPLDTKCKRKAYMKII